MIDVLLIARTFTGTLYPWAPGREPLARLVDSEAFVVCAVEAVAVGGVHKDLGDFRYAPADVTIDLGGDVLDALGVDAGVQSIRVATSSRSGVRAMVRSCSTSSTSGRERRASRIS